MSDYFNSFANPQGGGGSDIPPWLQALINRQMGQGQGGQPAGPLAANPANLPASPNMANMSVVGLPSSSGFTLPNGTPAPVDADASLTMPASRVVAGHSPAAVVAQPPAQSPPVAAANVKPQPQQQKPPPVKKPAPAQPVNAGPQGAVDAASPTASPASSNMPWPNQVDPTGTWGQRPDTSATTSITPSTGPLYPYASIAGAPSNGSVPNLGYYRPTMGNAQGSPTWVPQGATGSPQMFRGPLALPGSQNYYAQPAAGPAQAAAPPPPAAASAAPAGAGPGPIAPGVGTQWLRKMLPGVFGGGYPTT